MKGLLLVIFLLSNIFVYSQQKTKICLKEDGPITLSFGFGIHTMTYITHRKEELNNNQKMGLVFSTTVGVGLYILSFEKKEIKYRPKF